MNFTKLVIPLHFIAWKKRPNNAVTPQRQSQFTPKMKANVVPRLLSSLVWIDQYNECNGMTSFMEFMSRALSDKSVAMVTEAKLHLHPFSIIARMTSESGPNILRDITCVKTHCAQSVCGGQTRQWASRRDRTRATSYFALSRQNQCWEGALRQHCHMSL